MIKPATDSPKYRPFLDQAIQDLAESTERKEKIYPIIMANNERGRFRHFLTLDGSEDKDDETLQLKANDYVECVNNFYHTYVAYVQAIMAGDNELWIPLYEKMQKWAYRFLTRKGFYASQETLALAIDYAGEAGGALINSTFPYDSAFDAWAIELVRNVCKKNMRRAKKQGVIPPQQLVALTPELPVRDSKHNVEDFVGNEYDMAIALAQLTDRETQVIVWTREGVPNDEIASRLDISTNNLYRVRHGAIRKMRDALNNGDNLSPQ